MLAKVDDVFYIKLVKFSPGCGERLRKCSSARRLRTAERRQTFVELVAKSDQVKVQAKARFLVAEPHVRDTCEV